MSEYVTWSLPFGAGEVGQSARRDAFETVRTHLGGIEPDRDRRGVFFNPVGDRQGIAVAPSS
jgi:hypothetical protein